MHRDRTWVCFTRALAGIVLSAGCSTAAFGIETFVRFPPVAQGAVSDSSYLFDLDPGRTGYILANDFTFPNDTAINRVHWYGDNSGTPFFNLHPFVVQVFGDAGGLPASTALLDWHLMIAPTNSFPIFGASAYHYDAPLPPTVLTGGARYWLSIYEDDPSTSSWVWLDATHTSNTNYGLAIRNVLPNADWRGGFLGFPSAFIVQGELVPEPAGAWPLIGTLVVVALNRKERNRHR